MAIRNKTTNIYTEWLPLVESLPNDIAGAIFKNILRYQNGEEINNSFPVWIFIKSKIDEYNNKLADISEKRKKSGSYGGKAKASKCYQMLASDSKCSNKIKENKIKENKINNNNVLINEDFNFGDCEAVREIANKYNERVLDSLHKFLVGTFMGQRVDVAWIKKQAERFANGN